MQLAAITLLQHQLAASDTIFSSLVHVNFKDNSSSVAEMGDRGHNRHGPEIGSLSNFWVCPFFWG